MDNQVLYDGVAFHITNWLGLRAGFGVAPAPQPGRGATRDWHLGTTDGCPLRRVTVRPTTSPARMDRTDTRMAYGEGAATSTLTGSVTQLCGAAGECLTQTRWTVLSW